MKPFVFIFLIAFFISCEKDCNLPVQIIGIGEIIGNARVSQPLITWEMRNKEHIIRTDQENVYDLKVSFDEGKTYDSIDFNKYTLLGKYADGSCNVTFDRNVLKISSENKYLFRIKIYQCGTCKRHWESMNWVLVPKIQVGYSVEFLVE